MLRLRSTKDLAQLSLVGEAALAKPKSKQKTAEDDFDFQAKAYRLPAYKRQYMFAFESDQREWKFDFAFLDYKVAVEVEGLVMKRIDGKMVCLGRHVHPSGYEEDCIKYATGESLGWHVLRFNQHLVKNGTCIKFVIRTLTNLGWKGP